MKIKSFAILISLLVSVNFFAQDSKGWNPTLISFDGTNENGGVAAWYKLTSCNNLPVVVIKLINNNDFSVKATWVNLIQTNDNRDLYAPGQVTYNLPPKSEKVGACGDAGGELIIKLSDIGLIGDNFKTLIGSNFTAVKRDAKIQNDK